MGSVRTKISPSLTKNIGYVSKDEIILAETKAINPFRKQEEMLAAFGPCDPMANQRPNNPKEEKTERTQFHSGYCHITLDLMTELPDMKDLQSPTVIDALNDSRNEYVVGVSRFRGEMPKTEIKKVNKEDIMFCTKSCDFIERVTSVSGWFNLD